MTLDEALEKDLELYRARHRMKRIACRDQSFAAGSDGVTEIWRVSNYHGDYAGWHVVSFSDGRELHVYDVAHGVPERNWIARP